MNHDVDVEYRSEVLVKLRDAVRCNGEVTRAKQNATIQALSSVLGVVWLAQNIGGPANPAVMVGFASDIIKSLGETYFNGSPR